MRSLFLALILVTGGTGGAGTSPNAGADAERLLELHRGVLRAHLEGDVKGWLSQESDDFVVANRGEVTRPSRAERHAFFEPYLRETRFEEYRDLIPPIVRVSRDGTLGWVIAQVRGSGVRKTGSGGARVEFTSAWIELFEKRDGRWTRVGNVSNFKPPA